MKRFWDKVNKTGTCWLWIASTRAGYGAFKFQNKLESAHRVSWFLAYKKYPSKLILHTCDNKICVNPSHLFEGTHKDNTLDAIKKGRFIPSLPKNRKRNHGNTLYKHGCRCEICCSAQREHNARRSIRMQV